MRAGVEIPRCQWCDKPVEHSVPGLLGEGQMHPECRVLFDAEEAAAWKKWQSLNPPKAQPDAMNLHEWLADLKARWSLPR
jgi:hypothetical protein